MIAYFFSLIVLIIFFESYIFVVNGVIEIYLSCIALKSVFLVDFTEFPTGPISADIVFLFLMIIGFFEICLFPKIVYFIPLILENGISGILIL